MFKEKINIADSFILMYSIVTSILWYDMVNLNKALKICASKEPKITIIPSQILTQLYN